MAGGANMLSLVLMAFAFVCFVLSAWPLAPLADSPYHPRLIALGLAFWSLVVLLAYAGVK
jgi:hypothetical protein